LKAHKVKEFPQSRRRLIGQIAGENVLLGAIVEMLGESGDFWVIRSVIMPIY